MSVSGRVRARTGILVMAGVWLLAATPASAAVAAGMVLGGLALARSRRTA